GRLPERISLGARGQGPLAVDRFAIGIDDTAEPAVGGIDRTVMAAEDRLASEAHTTEFPKGQAEGVAIAKADDFRCQVVAVGGLDHDPAANAQFAYRPDNLDQQPLDGFHPSKNFHFL